MKGLPSLLKKKTPKNTVLIFIAKFLKALI